MKIIIIDDSAKNLEAAKKAAEQFPEHEFEFADRASEALGTIASFDGVITDLFFPDENHGEGTALGDAYGEYLAKLKKDEKTYLKVLKEYYDYDFERAVWKFECAIGMATDGTSRVAVEGLIRSCEEDGDRHGLEAYRKRLENLPPAQFPYGGAIMLRAHELGKKLCLVSDIHSHAGNYTDNVSSVDGMMLLLPLIGEGIVSVREATYDGEGSLKYMGSDELSHAIGGYPDGVLKERSEVWVEAIRRVAAQ